MWAYFHDLPFSYAIIPLIVFGASAIGAWLSMGGKQKQWYHTLKLPKITPPDWVFGIAWNIIFVCMAISWIIVWKDCPCQAPITASALFMANLALNVGWSYLFFYKHMIGASVVDALLLWLSVITLMIMTWPLLKAASFLLVPYALWGLFAIYLDYQVWKLN